MRIIVYVLVSGVAGAVSFGFSLLIWRLSTRFRLSPKIRDRDVHTTPTPRLGGIAMFLGVAAAFLLASRLSTFDLVFADTDKVLSVLAAAFVIVLIGVADDLWDLDWITKLSGQMIAAGVLVWQGVQLITIPLPGVIVILSPFQSLVITVLLVVLVMNAINFVDGLDGLVAGVAIIASSAFFVYTYIVSYGPTNDSDYFNLASLITAALIGTCIGFLPLNWHPAKLFMGDAGALLIGLLMAASTVAVTGQILPGQISDAPRLLVPAFIPIVLPFAVLLVPLLDFALAVIRRLRAGKSPFSADRQHLHHRLLDMGHSHFHAVLIFYAWTIVASVGCLLFFFMHWWWALLIVLGGFALCAFVTLAPLSRRKRAEAWAQRARDGDEDLARYDPLDAAADGDTLPD